MAPNFPHSIPVRLYKPLRPAVGVRVHRPRPRRPIYRPDKREPVRERAGPRRLPMVARLVAATMLFCLYSTSHASELDTQSWKPVESPVLAAMRGGFIGPSGLEISLGIERLVTLNGAVVSRMHVAIPDIGRLGATEARVAAQALSAINLVRNGTDTIGASPALTTPGATLIQNSMNGQHIDSRTVINSSVNTLGLLTSLNFQGSLGDAIARSARPF